MPPELKLVTAETDALVPRAAFTEALSTLASGVVLVTCRVGDRLWGMTVTAFAPVAADPPTILVSLRSDTTAAQAIAASGEFGVSILSAEQVDVARRVATPGAPKFLEQSSLAGVLAELECELAEAVEVADHTVLFGRVRAVRTPRPGRPLVYHRRAYRTVTDTNERSIRCLTS